MGLDDSWFTEVDDDIKTAWSAKIRAKVYDRQTPYQHIEVFETEGLGYLMVIDGFTMVSTLENFLYHEMMAHPVLFTHQAPRQVAIIGGGDCGTLREVMRHPGVEHCVQIDIDEGVTEAARRFFPELCEANDDPRAELLFQDGIQWMKDAAPESLDVIIVDSTDPIGPGEVLFTPTFYRACHRALRPGGLIVQQSESPLAHMHILQRVRRGYREAGFDAVETLFFPQPIYPTGWWSATLGGKGQNPREFRETDARNKPFATRYYNADIHRGALAQPEFFREAMEKAEPA
ncbi:MAG: polyamine aminopropyltransferase [Gammaproteobacteria bacterium]|nr:MAG: polyamine aminopropyltransferase [Gammaproteobacteria bacterium]